MLQNIYYLKLFLTVTGHYLNIQNSDIFKGLLLCVWTQYIYKYIVFIINVVTFKKQWKMKKDIEYIFI